MDSLTLLELRRKRGEVLRQARRKYGITKVALSVKTGLSRVTITNIESGGTSWTVDSEILYLNGLKLCKQ